MYAGISCAHPISIFMMLAHILVLVIVHDVHVRRPAFELQGNAPVFEEEVPSQITIPSPDMIRPQLHTGLKQSGHCCKWNRWYLYIDSMPNTICSSCYLVVTTN